MEVTTDIRIGFLELFLGNFLDILFMAEKCFLLQLGRIILDQNYVVKKFRKKIGKIKELTKIL